MRFEAASKDIVTGKYYKRSNNLEVLEQFMESDLECVRIVGHKWTSVFNGTKSLNQSIKRYHLGGIKAFSRKGEIYLVKTNT